MGERRRSPTTASSATTPTPASRCPTPRSASTARAPTPARSTTSPTRSTVRRASAARTTSRPRTTTCSSRASPATRTGSATSGSPTTSRTRTSSNLVSVDAGDGCVAPSDETIQDGDVHAALAAAVHVPVDRRARRRPEVAAFMQFVADNYDTIAEPALIVPMDETQASKAQADAREGARLRPLEGPPADTRAHGGSRHSGGRRDAGGESPRRPPPPLGRGGDPGRALARRGDLGPDDDPDRRRPAQRVDPVLQGRRAPTSSPRASGRRCSSRSGVRRSGR